MDLYWKITLIILVVSFVLCLIFGILGCLEIEIVEVIFLPICGGILLSGIFMLLGRVLYEVILLILLS